MAEVGKGRKNVRRWRRWKRCTTGNIMGEEKDNEKRGWERDTLKKEGKEIKKRRKVRSRRQEGG